jgi:translation elongation factor P/translation initiation factor 5A
MIQPQELRIGNYVEYDGKIFPVLNVDALNEYKETGDKGTVTLMAQ